MADPRRWWRRHPVWSAVLLLLSLVLVAAGVLGARAALVLASIGPRAEYWEQRATQPGEVVQIAVGDSLSQGIGASDPEHSFVGVLAQDTQERTGRTVRVVNLSVSGATTADVIDVQLPQLQALLGELAAQGVPVALVTLCIGANDAGATTPQTYRRELEQVLAAMPSGTFVTDVPDFNGGPRRPAAAALAQVAREEVGAREDLVLVPLEAYTGEQSLTDYAGDFFHPSDAGYERYVAAFRDTIDEVDPQPGVPVAP